MDRLRNSEYTFQTDTQYNQGDSHPKRRRRSKLTFFVKSYREINRVSVSAELTDTIHVVLNQLLNHPSEIPQHSLLYNGTVLQEWDTLESCGVSNDCLLNLERTVTAPVNKGRSVDVIVNEGICSSAKKLLVLRDNKSSLEERKRLFSLIQNSLKDFMAKAMSNKSQSSSIVEAFISAGAGRAFVSLLAGGDIKSQGFGSDCISMVASVQQGGPNSTEAMLCFSPLLADISSSLRTNFSPEELYDTQTHPGASYDTCRTFLVRFFASTASEMKHSSVVASGFCILQEAMDRIQKGLQEVANCSHGCLSSTDAASFASMAALFSYPDAHVGDSVQRALNLLAAVDSCLLQLFKAAMEAESNAAVKEAMAALSQSFKSNLLLILSGLDTAQQSLLSVELSDRFRAVVCQWKGPLNALLLSSSSLPPDNHLLWLLHRHNCLLFESKEKWVQSRLPVLSLFHDDRVHFTAARGPSALTAALQTIGAADRQKLRNGLNVVFENEASSGPGVIREVFAIIAQAAFDSSSALFLCCPTDRQKFSPNPESSTSPASLSRFHFIGRLLALAMAHRVTLSCKLSRPFFLLLTGRPVTLEDISDLDPEMYTGLRKLLELPEADVDDMGLTFEVTGAGNRAVELKPGGSTCDLTAGNRMEYVQLLVQVKFVESIRAQVEAVRSGFQDLLDGTPLCQVLEPLEVDDFNLLLAGSDADVSVDDWMAHTTYQGYASEDEAIVRFWNVVCEMSPHQRRNLVYFTTSVARLPSSGFGGLEHRFTIVCSDVDVGRLPTSHTCFCQLLLPPYPSMEDMRQKLMKVAEDDLTCGFGIA